MIDYYISQVENIFNSELSINDKYFSLKELLLNLSSYLVKDEGFIFHNPFSSIVFISKKYNLPITLQSSIHKLRSRKKQKDNNIKYNEVKEAQQTILDLCNYIIINNNDKNKNIISEKNKKIDKIRAHISYIDIDASYIKCISSDNKEIVVKSKSSIQFFNNGNTINILDFYFDNNNICIAEYIILEPDYLIDASSISFCFQEHLKSPLHYFINKFKTIENRSYILLGNIANFFLDELVFGNNEDILFEDCLKKSFNQFPFEYTSCLDILSDDNFREFINKAKNTFENIKRVVNTDFLKNKIELNNCILEPSFFCEKYGFQGRLDLLHRDTDTAESTIIELKSGKLPYKYSQKNIHLSYHVQVLVYRLMIKTVFSINDKSINSALLYSIVDNNGGNLRFAPIYKELEKEIIDIRNNIVFNELQVILSQHYIEDLFNNIFNISQSTASNIKLHINSINKLKNTISKCSNIEINYFYRYIRFISQELYINKIGNINSTSFAVSDLWLKNFEDRVESLNILYDLTILDIKESDYSMNIIFDNPNSDSYLSNFREGDICIVYPKTDLSYNVLNTQILKGTIVSIVNSIVNVRFRYKQKNKNFFTNNNLWAIEHDSLDNAINSMYKNMFYFIDQPELKKSILLGIKSPLAIDRKTETKDTEYTESIINKAIDANNYFLIVGPPGTGKTSTFARKLIEKYYSNKNNNIMILAYTNRAIDELCVALNTIFNSNNGLCDKYIRIGSELSCGKEFRHRLLKNISNNVNNRKELKEIIINTRIYISTIASLNSQLSLFSIKKFNIAIIDEASQILEPQIIGLLNNFDKFIMIGDHNQLSTIVLQDKQTSEIKDEILNNIGFINCRDSMFERMIRNCIKNNWTDNYAQLNLQWRMHQDIAYFPKKQFYNNNLNPATQSQKQPLPFKYKNIYNIYESNVSTKRIAFFSTSLLDLKNTSDKLNQIEANIVVDIIKSIYKVYNDNNIKIKSQNIGIITPYRNQIALIKNSISKINIDNSEDIMIETVERFQGSQRDIIIISLCVNNQYQLNFLSNTSYDEKVDKKLNVAITRARKQLFIIGNSEILKKNTIYAKLLDTLQQQNNVIELK